MIDYLKIQLSMTENGDPYENAIAERINGILKYEHGLKETFSNFETAKTTVDRAIKAYNELRIHDSCNRLTPIQAHEEKGVLKKFWKKKKYQKQEKSQGL
jgi:transposase InsO family protein